MTPVSLSDQLKRRPANRGAVDALKAEMLREVEAYRLADLRKELNVSQKTLAQLAHISQNRVSQIERGDIEHTQIDTIRKYVEALGGTIEIRVKIANESYILT
ncbi:helix-turn-helix domain-containing protein [Pseudarthrobacter sp. DSP2-3-2b1]|uniref:helix-turn-helix domain-containing protein n=1 Tax=Pseudarthrobacter sp. DSP2-3-2b1 TaxID=2804661 RepID=UPI003CF3BD7E